MRPKHADKLFCFLRPICPNMPFVYRETIFLSLAIQTFKMGYILIFLKQQKNSPGGGGGGGGGGERELLSPRKNYDELK